HRSPPVPSRRPQPPRRGSEAAPSGGPETAPKTASRPRPPGPRRPRGAGQPAAAPVDEQDGGHALRRPRRREPVHLLRRRRHPAPELNRGAREAPEQDREEALRPHADHAGAPEEDPGEGEAARLDAGPRPLRQ